jgi:hypothetical protein
VSKAEWQSTNRCWFYYLDTCVNVSNLSTLHYCENSFHFVYCSKGFCLSRNPQSTLLRTAARFSLSCGKGSLGEGTSEPSKPNEGNGRQWNLEAGNIVSVLKGHQTSVCLKCQGSRGGKSITGASSFETWRLSTASHNCDEL